MLYALPFPCPFDSVTQADEKPPDFIIMTIGSLCIFYVYGLSDDSVMLYLCPLILENLHAIEFVRQNNSTNL
jgi:hypothetical protein